MNNLKELCDTYISMKSIFNQIEKIPKKNRTNQQISILEMHNILYCIIKGRVFEVIERAIPLKDVNSIKDQIELLEKEGIIPETADIFSLMSEDDFIELQSLIEEQNSVDTSLKKEEVL